MPACVSSHSMDERSDAAGIEACVRVRELTMATETVLDWAQTTEWVQRYAWFDVFVAAGS